MVARKDIAWAIINQLNGQGPQTSPLPVPTDPTFPTVGRRLPDPETLSGGTFPALYLIKPSETYTYDGEGDAVPPTRVLDFLAVIYTDFNAQPNVVIADVIDDLMDGIDAAIAPSGSDYLTSRQTLGGLVYNCVVYGEPKFAPGDEQGKGETLVPIRVTLNQYP
jgi:hypothetical protein